MSRPNVETDVDAHEGGTNSASFSPDGAALATDGADYIARLWDTASWQLSQELRHEEIDKGTGNMNTVLCAAFSRTRDCW